MRVYHISSLFYFDLHIELFMKSSVVDWERVFHYPFLCEYFYGEINS